jgi:hypothetical protein
LPLCIDQLPNMASRKYHCGHGTVHGPVHFTARQMGYRLVEPAWQELTQRDKGNVARGTGGVSPDRGGPMATTGGIR